MTPGLYFMKNKAEPTFQNQKPQSTKFHTRAFFK